MNRFILISKNILCTVLLIIVFFYPTFGDEKQKITSFVNSIADRVVDVIESQSSNEQKREKLNDIFCEYVDIDWMGKFALGKYYRKLNKEQLQEYLIAYRNFLINTYVSKFTEYNGQNLYIESVKVLSKSQYVVNIKINNPKNATEQINISYRIKDFSNQYQIRDMIVEGLSVIIGQKSDFDSIISKDGINSLIQRLRNKGKNIR